MSQFTSSRSFLAVVAVLFLTSLIPLPLTNWIGGKVADLVTPVSQPLELLSRSLRRPSVPGREDDPERLRLQEELERARSRIANLEARAASLARQLQTLQDLHDIDPRFRYLTAARSAETAAGRSPQFRVNRGSQHGVVVEALALFEGYQLIGRVTEVSARTSVITPITQRGSGPLDVSILPPDSAASIDDAVAATLEAVGDGTLVGQVGVDRTVAVGHRVVFRDEHWAQIHTGPLVGLVERVEPRDDAPLWNRIVVRPSYPVDRVALVVLKVPADR